MAVLSKDEYFEKLRKMIGDDTTDESISVLEDFTDTYEDFERRLSNNGEDWEKKAKEIDEAWKRRYRNRFFNGNGGNITVEEENAEETEVYDPEDVTIEDLFD